MGAAESWGGDVAAKNLIRDGGPRRASTSRPEKLFTVLNHEGVEYVVIGGIAAILHAASVVT